MIGEAKSTKGLVFVVLSAFFFAIEYLLFDAVFQKSNISPQSALFWAFLTIDFIVFPFFLFKRQQRRKLAITIQRDGMTVLGISVISTFAIFSLFWGIAESNSGIASLLHETQMIFIPLLGVVLLKEILGWRQLLGIALALIGFICISSLKGEASFGVVAAVVFSAFLYSLQSFFIKKYAPGLSGPSFSFLRTIIITLLWGMGMVLFGQGLEPPSWQILLLLFVAGMSGTFVSQIFYFEAHNYLPISTLNIYSLAQPVFVLVGSILLLNAPFSLLKGIGALLILSGLVLVTHGHMTSRKREIEDRISGI